MRFHWIILVIAVVLGECAAADMLRGGRSEEAGRGFAMSMQAGAIKSFQAAVQETTRKLYDVMGEDWKQDRANYFEMDDFNISGTHPLLGLGLQRQGRFFTFLADANAFSLSSDAVARRDYYLNDVGRLVYDGQAYDNMVISEGDSFSFAIQGAALEFRLQMTPLTFQPASGLRIVPFFDAGLFGFVGEYQIAAGASRGVVQYQNPMEEFVEGGRVRGISGMGLPEYGGGLEVRIGQPETRHLVLRGHYVVCRYSGGTSFLTSSSHREKHLEIDHANLRLQWYGVFPLKSGRRWFVGGQFQQIRSEGLVESSATDSAEIMRLRERFDKEFTFRMTLFSAMLGMRF